MNLVISPEIKKDINQYSGFINPNSRYGNKSLKGLFFMPENIKYLGNELYTLITNKDYVKNNLPDAAIYDIPTMNGTHDDPLYGFNNQSKYSDKANLIVQKFIKQKTFINSIIYTMVEGYPLPFAEEIAVMNPVQQLHSVNLDFLVKTSRYLIQNPQNLSANFNDINPDTGANESNVEWDFNASSYSDGTWHPETLFTNTNRNRANPYWVPLEVNIYSAPNAKGPGHRYNDILYNKGTKESYGNNGSKNNTFSQFPLWNTSVNNRDYDKEATLGLRDGGLGDRRVQRPSGYNMSSLINKSSY